MATYQALCYEVYRMVLSSDFEGAVSQKILQQAVFSGSRFPAKPKKVVDQKTELTDEVSSIIKLYPRRKSQADGEVRRREVDIDWANTHFKEFTSPRWMERLDSRDCSLIRSNEEPPRRGHHWVT